MSLTVKIGDRYDRSCIKVPLINGGVFYGLDLIPQIVRDCTSQAKIDIFEGPHNYVVTSRLPGVETRSLWVYIEGRALTLYAGITEGPATENRYPGAVLEGVKGEITLPVQVRQRPEIAKFDKGVLFLVIPKEFDEFLREAIVIYK